MKPHRRQPDKEKIPSNSPECLPANLEFEGDSQADGLPSRIARYSRAKERALAMRDYLVTIGETKAFEAAGLLQACGNYLHFRHYYTVDQVRLHAAHFCKQHLICPLCAIRRGSKTLSGT